MGLFCVNMHFRSTDEKALTAAVNRRGVKHFRVLPAKGGWTTLYEERASEQDDGRIRDLAGGLSRDLSAAAIAFLVHDSDIACYWLYENGQLLDEYNSCPNYWDDDATEKGTPTGGTTDVLVRYCRQGVTHDELADILGQDTLYAENVIEQLADALGIDQTRALADYRDGTRGGGPPGGGGPGDDDDDDDGGGSGGRPDISQLREAMAGRFAQMLGSHGGGAADPQVSALVQAAVKGDLAEMDRLIAVGVAIDAEAPAELAGQPAGGMVQMSPGGVPKVPMTPLMASVAHKRRQAVERLLDRGADVNRVHALFGTVVHAAAGAGDVETVRLLIDRGADINLRNTRGQSPLQVVMQARVMAERLAQAQTMMKTMGVKLPGAFNQLSNRQLPTEGWEACERLLKEHGAH
jgi:hypothetical protein